ncbi:MAG: hypothetical protein V5A25_05365 [Halovenus sp.]
MDRRTLLTASVAVIGSAVTGCLENMEFMGDSDDSEDNDASDDSNDQADQDSNHDAESIRETRFEILGSDYEFEISASVTFENEMVTVTGTISGNNTCYTASLDTVTTENHTLLVNIESYEDADENGGCRDAVIGIEYETIAKFDGEPPTEVTVEHNGEKVTTEQRL